MNATTAAYTFRTSTDHGQTWMTLTTGLSAMEALQGAFDIASAAGRFGATYPDRWVVQTELEGERGTRWMWIAE